MFVGAFGGLHVSPLFSSVFGRNYLSAELSFGQMPFTLLSYIMDDGEKRKSKAFAAHCVINLVTLQSVLAINNNASKNGGGTGRTGRESEENSGAK